LKRGDGSAAALAMDKCWAKQGEVEPAGLLAYARWRSSCVGKESNSGSNSDSPASSDTVKGAASKAVSSLPWRRGFVDSLSPEDPKHPGHRKSSHELWATLKQIERDALRATDRDKQGEAYTRQRGKHNTENAAGSNHSSAEINRINPPSVSLSLIRFSETLVAGESKTSGTSSSRGSPIDDSSNSRTYKSVSSGMGSDRTPHRDFEREDAAGAIRPSLQKNAPESIAARQACHNKNDAGPEKCVVSTGRTEFEATSADFANADVNAQLSANVRGFQETGRCGVNPDSAQKYGPHSTYSVNCNGMCDLKKRPFNYE
jgi:hypothetical protein